MEVTINYNGQIVTVEVTLEVYEFLDRASFIANTLGSNPCTCVYCLLMKRPSCRSFD